MISLKVLPEGASHDTSTSRPSHHYQCCYRFIGATGRSSSHVPTSVQITLLIGSWTVCPCDVGVIHAQQKPTTCKWTPISTNPFSRGKQQVGRNEGKNLLPNDSSTSETQGPPTSAGPLCVAGQVTWPRSSRLEPAEAESICC